MGYILRSQMSRIMKRGEQCPEGQHKHPGYTECHSLDKPHKPGTAGDKWHQENGIENTWYQTHDEPPTGENGEPQPDPTDIFGGLGDYVTAKVINGKTFFYFEEQLSDKDKKQILQKIMEMADDNGLEVVPTRKGKFILQKKEGPKRKDLGKPKKRIDDSPKAKRDEEIKAKIRARIKRRDVASADIPPLCKDAMNYKMEDAENFMAALPYADNPLKRARERAEQISHATMDSKNFAEQLDMMGFDVDGAVNFNSTPEVYKKGIFDACKAIAEFGPYSLTINQSLAMHTMSYLSQNGYSDVDRLLGFSNPMTGLIGLIADRVEAGGSYSENYGYAQKYSSTEDEAISPLGYETTVSFHWSPRDRDKFTDDDWKRYGIKYTMAHEMGHSESYALANALEFERYFDMRYEQTLGHPIPEGMSYDEAYAELYNVLRTKSVNKRINSFIRINKRLGNPSPTDETIKAMRQRFTDEYVDPDITMDLYGLPTLSGVTTTGYISPGTKDSYLLDCVKEIEGVYKELYELSDDEFDPFDVYTTYGYYGNGVHVPKGRKMSDTYFPGKEPEEPDGKEKKPKKKKKVEDGKAPTDVVAGEERLYANERFAEAYADVATRGKEANSMSVLYVAYAEYTLNRVYSGSKKSFRDYIFEELSEEQRQQIRDNRMIKAISQRRANKRAIAKKKSIAKRNSNGHCPPGYHKNSNDGQCHMLDVQGKPTGPTPEMRVRQQAQAKRTGKYENAPRPNGKQKMPSAVREKKKGEKKYDNPYESFIVAKPGTEAYKLVRNLRTGNSPEAIQSRKALIEWSDRHGGMMPYIRFEPFEINGNTFTGTETSYTMFTDENGEYTPERQKFHQDIARKMLSRMPRPTDRKPIVAFTGGGTASGKGALDEHLAEYLGVSLDVPRRDGETDEQYKRRAGEVREKRMAKYKIDPDAIMELLPEYKEYINHDMIGGASVFHREASDIAKKVFEMALDDGRDVVYDGTFSSKKPLNWAKNIDKDRYDSYLVSKQTDEDICMERSKKRFINGGKNGEYPRIVPTSILKDTNRGHKKIMREEPLDELFTGYKIVHDKQNKGNGDKKKKKV